jgi:anti-sigma B factor antagonist
MLDDCTSVGSATMRIDVYRPQPRVAVLTVIGEIDNAAAGRLSAGLHRELEQRPALVVVDLTGVSFLGRAGLRVLGCAAARAECASVSVVLVHGDSQVPSAALGLADLSPLMRTFRTVAQAISAATSPVDTKAR